MEWRVGGCRIMSQSKLVPLCLVCLEASSATGEGLVVVVVWGGGFGGKWKGGAAGISWGLLLAVEGPRAAALHLNGELR